MIIIRIFILLLPLIKFTNSQFGKTIERVEDLKGAVKELGMKPCLGVWQGVKREVTKFLKKFGSKDKILKKNKIKMGILCDKVPQKIWVQR